jgi:hypothetical protein
MSLGRCVPWYGWDEWAQVRDWLLSNNINEARKGLDRVIGAACCIVELQSMQILRGAKGST